MLQSRLNDEEFFKKALDSAKQGVWDVNQSKGYIYLSDVWFEIRGLTAARDDAVPWDYWENNLHPEDRARVEAQNQKMLTGESLEVNYEYRERHADGRWIWIMSRGRTVEWDASGKPVRFAGTDTEITRIKATEERLNRTQRRLELALSSINAGVWRFRMSDELVEWDEQERAIYGLPIDNAPLPRDVWERALHPEDKAAAMAAAVEAVRTKSDYSLEYRIVRPDGAVRFIRSKVSFIEEGTEGPQMVGLDFDITEDREFAEALRQAKDLAERRYGELESARAEMEYQALHDALTGLPNRRYLEQVQDRAEGIGNTTRRSAILLMDIDRLKQVNDVLGHAAGDHVLCLVAALLRDQAPTDTIAARTGGGEFALFLRDAPDDAGLIRIAQDLIARVAQPSFFQGRECRVGLSIGIAVGEGDEIDGKRLFINANIALYRARENSRQHYAFYAESQRQVVEKLKDRSDALIAAVERRDFICHYQPQFDARSGAISGVEALVRWPQPDGQILAPGEFLPVAEQLGLLASIDRIVLQKAVADFADWQALGLDLPRLSVNFSSARLAEEGLESELAALAIDPGRLTFELLETTLLEEFDPCTSRRLDNIRKLGIGIEVDDFGTGHASVFSLLRLKPDRLKIDRKLVSLVAESKAHEQILVSIIEIGHLLGISIVAEGIETDQQRRRMTDLGCDYLQGFALAPPMASADLLGLLAVKTALFV